MTNLSEFHSVFTSIALIHVNKYASTKPLIIFIYIYIN